MEAEGDNHIIRFIFTGEDGEVVPEDATHVTVDKSVTVIPERAFYFHQNILEFECHDGVEKVEEMAFYDCPFLRRVKMPGVKIVESEAFWCCKYLADVECDKLERIVWEAFFGCESLRSINLPSIKIVEEGAFEYCTGLTDVKFGDKLERIEGRTFLNCKSLELIAIPLSNRIIDDRDDEASYHDDVFQCCEDLKRVDLIGGVHENIAALHRVSNR